MATLFNITPNDEGGYDVFARDLLPGSERRARLNYLLAQGSSRREAAMELLALEAPRRMNSTPTCGLALCREYVASHIDPGDLVIEAGAVFVVGTPGRA